MKCHEVDYTIFGDDMQTVEIELDPGETVIAEAGAMNWMEDGILFETRMGDGSEPDKGFMGKLLDAGKRAVAGESLFMTHFTNQGPGKKERLSAPLIQARSSPSTWLGGRTHMPERRIFMCGPGYQGHHCLQ